MLKSLGWTVRRELLLAWRRRSDTLAPLGFFVIAASLFPLGAGAEPALLRAMAPGVLWVAALLSALLSLGRLFAPDHADGSLEQALLSGQPLAWLVLGKCVAHWLVSGLPLVLLSPLLALQFQLPWSALGVLLLALLLGTPVLSLVGAIGAALTLGLRGGGALLGLLVLPLYVPVLTFGAGAVGVARMGLSAQPHLLLLGGLLAGALALAPCAAAAALRLALD